MVRGKQVPYPLQHYIHECVFLKYYTREIGDLDVVVQLYDGSVAGEINPCCNDAVRTTRVGMGKNQRRQSFIDFSRTFI